ncbi:hypothetical protein [Actinomadura sp. 3N407]|uniref:hypothetical protein n=1 Tax=Actinomadura sp. 3N407 TaxID=3457423 RepID=UPI003FCC835B
MNPRVPAVPDQLPNASVRAATQADLRRGSSGKRRRHSATIHDGTAGRESRGVARGPGRGRERGGRRPCAGTASARRDGRFRVAERLSDDTSLGSGAARPGEGIVEDGGAVRAGDGVAAPGVSVRAGDERIAP